MVDAPAADTGVLSIDQAVTALSAPPKKEKEPAAETVEATPASEETEIEADPTAENVAEPEEAIEDESEAEQEESESEVEEAQQTSLEPPRFWDAKQKELFRGLSKEAQETILAHEDLRSAATSRALQEATEKRKAADGEASRLAQLAGDLDKLLPQAKQRFKSRWEGVDWNAVIDQYGADQALKLKNEFEAEQTEIQQLEAAKVKVTLENTKRHVADRLVKLQTTCPDLVDTKEGPARQQQLVTYLSGLGVPSKVVIEAASDVELGIAYKAMLWDQAQAKTAKLAQTQKTPPANRPAVRPTPPSGHRSPNNARIQTLSKKPTLSVDEAVELATLRGT
jgi:hypothetical protein